MSNADLLSTGLRQAFIRLIAKHTGLEVRERDQATLIESIFLRMKILKLPFPENYYQLLELKTADSYHEWQRLVLIMTNLESHFFRDKDQFSLLKNQILPELIQRQQATKTLRICSAGCSTGEEPYSIAILLKELLPDLEKWQVLILGADINQTALEKARAGIYRAWSFRNVDAAIKQRYFRLVNERYHIDERIKEMVKFQSVNLVKDPFLHPSSELQDMDLILCRNVFIYFEPLAIGKVLDKFYHALQPLGYLITGHAELYGQDLSLFQIKVFPESLTYQRHADNFAIQPSALEVNTHQVALPSELNYLPVENLSWEFDQSILESNLGKNTINLHQAALNLLKQLPPDTKLPKLGNLTAAELIIKVEAALSLINKEPK
ncbi:MAG TPA: chemotaxis protein CheR [Cyanobacteria bacterium UBA8803]|nr:chemotaxis protein CheR [Cyanobacteria bacterium UBA9273]HBL61142.1 chemotaxis protein CheR [Cyanobacteria bacterium UBA8803]